MQIGIQHIDREERRNQEAEAKNARQGEADCQQLETQPAVQDFDLGRQVRSFVVARVSDLFGQLSRPVGRVGEPVRHRQDEQADARNQGDR